ncbi:MAG: DUF4406 domain-containing protein [Gammaproteobacteria bacterium]
MSKLEGIDTVYVSGPMTGLPEFNYPAFNAAAAQLRAAGYRVENPAENETPPCGTWQGFMRLSLAQIARCDALYVLDAWERSRGAWLEITIARELELLIDFDRTLLLPDHETTSARHPLREGAQRWKPELD